MMPTRPYVQRIWQPLDETHEACPYTDTVRVRRTPTMLKGKFYSYDVQVYQHGSWMPASPIVTNSDRAFRHARLVAARQERGVS